MASLGARYVTSTVALFLRATFHLPCRERRPLSLCSAFVTEFPAGSAELGAFTDLYPTTGTRQREVSSTALGSAALGPVIRAGRSPEGELHDKREIQPA